MTAFEHGRFVLAEKRSATGIPEAKKWQEMPLPWRAKYQLGLT
jgi:hypothetical protein